MKLTVFNILLFQCLIIQAQNPLVIPPVLTGTNFNLTVQSGSKTFYGNKSTPTYGINGAWLGPTIIVNKGDSITLNVTNNLPVKTTMHWHGLHVASKNDGGPHQIIKPLLTWSPSFKVRNNAGTFWYHPHGAGQTDPQVSKGLAGLLIVKDSQEAALNLPRTYGVDDIPLIIQSKAFDDLQQIAIATDMDTALFINGTLHPYLKTPSQVMRFRLLNGSSLRSYNLGFSNGQKFYQIATDGGLLDSSLSLNRLRLSPGERAEILVNFSGMLGQTIYLKSYSSELPTGIYGADNVGSGIDTIPEYEVNFLNGKDFELLRLDIDSTTSGAITTVPAKLVPIALHDPLSATVKRTILMDTIRLLPLDPPNRAEGPFGMNKRIFDMDSINEIVYLNNTEIWTLLNKTLVAHPFHIHDVQFNIIEKGGMSPQGSERGWKDVVLVMPNDSVKFITKFTDFADKDIPYMYHCHLLHHEDDGMMGSFLVIDPNSANLKEPTLYQTVRVFPNPALTVLNIEFNKEIESAEIKIVNVLGETVLSEKINNNIGAQLDISTLNLGIYFLHIKSGNNFITQKLIKQ